MDEDQRRRGCETVGEPPQVSFARSMGRFWGTGTLECPRGCGGIDLGVSVQGRFGGDGLPLRRMRPTRFSRWALQASNDVSEEDSSACWYRPLLDFILCGMSDVTQILS